MNNKATMRGLVFFLLIFNGVTTFSQNVNNKKRKDEKVIIDPKDHSYIIKSGSELIGYGNENFYKPWGPMTIVEMDYIDLTYISSNKEFIIINYNCGDDCSGKFFLPKKKNGQIFLEKNIYYLDLKRNIVLMANYFDRKPVKYPFKLLNLLTGKKQSLPISINCPQEYNGTFDVSVYEHCLRTQVKHVSISNNLLSVEYIDNGNKLNMHYQIKI